MSISKKNRNIIIISVVGVILLGLSIRGGIDSVRYIENLMSTETITETTKNIDTDTVEYKMATIDNGCKTSSALNHHVSSIEPATICYKSQ